MSTKTTFKRIALVAVAALGAGLLSVVPASAGQANTSVVTGIIPTVSPTTVDVSTNTTIQVLVKNGNVANNGDVITIKAAVTSKPVGAATIISASDSTDIVESNGVNSGIGFSTTGTTDSVGALNATYSDVADGSSSATFSAAGVDFGDFRVQGDKAGSYTVRMWHDSDLDGVLDAGEQFADASFSVAGAASELYGSFTSSAATPATSVAVAEGSSTSVLITYSGVNDLNNNLYWVQNANNGNDVVAVQLTGDDADSAPFTEPEIVNNDNSQTGTIGLVDDNTSGQVRVDILMDLDAVSGESVKICYTSACSAGSVLLFLTVDTSLPAPTLEQATETSAAPFAVRTPVSNTQTVYSSATNATISQLATKGGYVEFIATHDDLSDLSLPSFKYIEVTGSTFISAYRSHLVDPSLTFNNANINTAPGATIAYVNVERDLQDTWFMIGTETVGQVTVRVKTRTFSAGIATDTTNQTFIINIGTSPATYNYSTVTVDAANNGWEAVDSTIYAPSTAGTVADSTNIAAVTVSQFAANNAAILAGTAKAVTATLTGVGSLTPSSSAGTSRTYEVRAAAGIGTETFKVYADGRAGTGSIAFAVDGVLVKTATIKFYGAATKVEAVPFYTIGREGNGITGYATGVLDSAAYTGSAGNYAGLAVTPTADNDTAIGVLVTDALGTPVPASVTVSSSNPGVIVPSTTSFLDSGASTLYSAGVWYRHFAFDTAPNSKSGQTATLTFTVTLANGTTLTATQALTVGGARYTETLSFDKTAYNAGDQMFVTRKAVDAAGNPVYDGATAPAITFNKATSGTIGASIYVGGVAVVSSRPTAYAPATTGAFEARMTGVTAGATSVITATATVEATGTAAEATAQAAADAAAEATDAANAATDAANSAAEAADAATAAAQDAADAVAALATQVATYISNLRKQITALTNLVIKIQKKVRA